MNIPLKIAFRYFKGKKATQAINIVSWISIGAVALSTAAMVILFSVYNGLESYVKGMYTSFYPELKVSTIKGKFFQLSDQKYNALKSIKGIKNIAFSAEDMVLLDGYDHQKVVRLKGVDNTWFKVNDMDKYIIIGTASWPNEQGTIPTNVGANIVAEMGIDAQNPFQKIKLYYPRANASFTGMDLSNALTSLEASPYASFSIQAELDGSYILIPLTDAQSFFDIGKKIGNIELQLEAKSDLKKIQSQVENIMGKDFEVLSRIEQNKTLFMATQMEKWMIYGILSLVLVIASFNMVGALSMLAIEKKLDVSILKSMGASQKMVRKIFLYLGSIIAITGALIGLIIGLIFILSQLQWGWLKMGDGLLEAYPVQLQLGDFIIVCTTVLLVGLAAAWYPSIKAAKHLMIFRDE